MLLGAKNGFRNPCKFQTIKMFFKKKTIESYDNHFKLC